MPQNLSDLLNTIFPDFLLYFLPAVIAIVFLIFASPTNTFEKQLEKSSKEIVERIAKGKESSSTTSDTSANIQEILGDSFILQHQFMQSNVSQNTKILIFAVCLMITGVLILIGGLIISCLPLQAETEKISSGAIVGGLVTQFIGGTIILLFKLVFKQTSEYYLSLEKLTAIRVALKLLNRLSSSDQEKLIPQLIDTILNHQLSKHSFINEPRSKDKDHE
ncbi:MAG: hypothetical protein KIH69_019510 [Anaerolineae bacterium]|nr:hypothetical protein [Anaerolineae bacterium]